LKYIYEATFDLIYASSDRVSIVRNIPNARLESRIILKPQCFQYLQVQVKVSISK